MVLNLWTGAQVLIQVLACLFPAIREVVGLSGEVKKQILERAKKYDADEVMLTMITHKLSDKIESYRLLAEAFSL